MSAINKNIGFIGAGNMGEAMIGALIHAEIFSPSMIFACDVNKERLNFIKNTYKIQLSENNSDLFNICDIIILAVKPQQMEQVLSAIAATMQKPLLKRKLIISIAAGVRIQKIEQHLYAQLDENNKKLISIIRVMPNTPALVLSGMSGMSPNPFADQEDIRVTRTILEAMGKVIEFKEDDLDAVTALSGSGPAYIFFLAECMIAAGIHIGLTPEASKTLSLTTISGAAKLMEERNEPPEELRRKVTSPGGTTEAAFKILIGKDVKKSFIDAIEAASNRSKELSR